METIFQEDTTVYYPWCVVGVEGGDSVPARYCSFTFNLDIRSYNPVQVWNINYIVFTKFDSFSAIEIVFCLYNLNILDGFKVEHIFYIRKPNCSKPNFLFIWIRHFWVFNRLFFYNITQHNIFMFYPNNFVSNLILFKRFIHLPFYSWLELFL